jgi:hypothetical protein
MPVTQGVVNEKAMIFQANWVMRRARSRSGEVS